MEAQVVQYRVHNKIAFVTLNRPNAFNAIDLNIPSQIKEVCSFSLKYTLIIRLFQAIEKANLDESVKVIILQGAGKAFCSGYDLKIFAETPRPCPV